ncbi:MAG: hypothetical protein ACFFDN_16990 [Candidatus Hodarchaeota archaeon]
MRYPRCRTVYAKYVGLTRVRTIKKILEDIGFMVNTNKIQAPGIDMRVFDSHNNLLLVIEVTNWKKTSYMHPQKLNSMNGAFRKYNCKKLYIASFTNNFKTKRSQIDNDIEILVLGYQTQPYWKWQEKNGDTTGMRPNSKKTLKSTKQLLHKQLKSMGLM